MLHKYREGKRVALPLHVLVYIVAARYGQSPGDVTSWPADEFARAVALETYLGGPRGE